MAINLKNIKVPTGFNFQSIIYLLGLYIIYKLITTITSVGTKDPMTGLPLKDKLDEDKATISDTQARSYADSFKKALIFEGIDTGTTSWELIKPILNKLYTNANFNKVYNAFGKVQYSPFFGNVGDPVTSSSYDLIFILNNELTNSQKDELNKNYWFLKIF